MTRPRDGNYLTVKWLSRLMAGDSQCGWGAWFRVHFRDFRTLPPSPQLVQWQIDHRMLLDDLVAQRTAAGERCYKEKQNDFRLHLTRTLVMAATPDLVAVAPGGSVTVYEAKTGSPRASDLIQLMLYMLCLPSALPLHKGKILGGCLVYRSGDRSPVPPEAISQDFRKQARHFVTILDSETPPARVPSAFECSFCDVSGEDCPERLEASASEEIPTLDWAGA